MKGEQFNDIEGNKVDPVSYTKKILKENPYVDIHIGTDSQSKAKKTLFTIKIKNICNLKLLKRFIYRYKKIKNVVSKGKWILIDPKLGIRY